MEKEYKARQQQKHDIEENWQKAGENGFVPKAAEIIVYDKYDKEGNAVADNIRYKIGDGISNINDLAFCNVPISTGITKTILWENASISSSFSAQDITIRALNEFDYVEVEFLRENSSAEKIYVQAYLPIRANSGSVVYGYYSTNLQPIERRVVLKGNTAISISGTYRPNTTTAVAAATTMLKPYRIYGIKGVEILS